MSQIEVSGVAEVTRVDAPPLSMDEFLSKVTRAVPCPLLVTPTPLHREKDNASCSRQHSGRLETRNFACTIMWARRAEHRLLEAFGELPEMIKVEGTKQKMKCLPRHVQKLAFAASDRCVEYFGKHRWEVEDGPYT